MHHGRNCRPKAHGQRAGDGLLRAVHHARAIVHGADCLARQHQAAAVIRQRAAASDDAQSARLAGAAQQQAVGGVERLVADVLAPGVLPGRDDGNALPSRAQVCHGRFGLAAGHQLAVDAVGLDVQVAYLGRGRQLSRAVIARGIGYGGVAQDGRARGGHKLAVGRRALEVHFERVAQFQRLYDGLVVDVAMYKGAPHRAHLGDADVLRALAGLSFVLHQ